MMTEERIRQYKARLEEEIREIQHKRGYAVDVKNYDAIAIYDRSFGDKVAEITAINYILSY